LKKKREFKKNWKEREQKPRRISGYKKKKEGVKRKRRDDQRNTKDSWKKK